MIVITSLEEERSGDIVHSMFLFLCGRSVVSALLGLLVSFIGNLPVRMTFDLQF